MFTEEYDEGIKDAVREIRRIARIWKRKGEPEYAKAIRYVAYSVRRLLSSEVKKILADKEQSKIGTGEDKWER